MLDPRLGAYEFVDSGNAMTAACALDALLAAGTDLGAPHPSEISAAKISKYAEMSRNSAALQCFEASHSGALYSISPFNRYILNAVPIESAGPLMGVPVGVKDLFEVRGMPLTAGSSLAAAQLSEIVGAEGPFIKSLKAAGAVILGKGCYFLAFVQRLEKYGTLIERNLALIEKVSALIGKTKTVEFAFSPTGINRVRGTPVNPHDAATHRLPGGSSSGSGVATAAGLAAFTIGSDTGGSVRIPAALNGVAGLKTTVGLWQTAGVFPLSSTYDTIGEGVLLSRLLWDFSRFHGTHREMRGTHRERATLQVHWQSARVTLRPCCTPLRQSCIRLRCHWPGHRSADHRTTSSTILSQP
eukprot:SAG31_NODE_1201_length_9418_cov_3.410881_2_plen_356_part_00